MPRKGVTTIGVTCFLVYFSFFFFIFHVFSTRRMANNSNFTVINGFPNPFAPLLPPALFSRAYCDNDIAFYAPEYTTLPPTILIPVEENVEMVPVISLIPPTPPLVIREDLYEIVEITQQEFLESIPGWNPVAAKNSIYY